MAGTFTVQLDTEEFRIVGPNGETGPETPYGEQGEEGNVATLTLGSDVYICRVEDPNSETQMVELVTQTRQMPTVTEEAKFEDEEPGDGEGGRVIDVGEGEGDDDDEGEGENELVS